MWMIDSRKFYIKLFLLCLLIFTGRCITSDNKVDEDSQRYSSLTCTKLRDLSDHIMQRLIETANKSYEGGNPDWINKNLPSYDVSEVRFIEVFDGSCDRIPNPTNCHDLYQKYEKDMYEWFLNHTNTTSSIYDDLFVNKLKICCNAMQYGPNCDTCKYINPDGKVCGGRGFCDGENTRTGDGSCNCHVGYIGEKCDQCDNHHYLASNGECHPCHIACKNGCTDFSESACIDNECSDGYEPVGEKGCKKIDYCANKTAVNCTNDEFCVSLKTNFECRKCDKSCNGCIGDSNKDCLSCANGYTVNNRSCDKIHSKRSKYRYMKYDDYKGVKTNDHNTKQKSKDNDNIQEIKANNSRSENIQDNDLDEDKDNDNEEMFKHSKKDKKKKSKKHKESKYKKKSKKDKKSFKSKRDQDDDDIFDEL